MESVVETSQEKTKEETQNEPWGIFGDRRWLVCFEPNLGI